MRARVQRISAWALVLLGLCHTGATPVFFSALSPAAVWFVGGGLALVFLGIVNLLPVSTVRDTALRMAANLLGLAFGVVVVWVVPVPQALLALILLGSVAVATAARRKEVQSW